MMPRLSPAHRIALLAAPLLVAAVALTGCKKEFDAPPERTIPTGAVTTLAQLRAMYQGERLHFPDTAGAITDVYAVVTADEQDGNLYKNIYVQDETAAILLRLRNSGGLYVGDRIRIHLPGASLWSFQGMLQLDSVDVDNNIVKQETGVVIEPETLTFQQITPAKQGKLVYLQNVQFNEADTATTWANAAAQTTGSHDLEDCGGNAIELRTSGFSDYAGRSLPNGKGSMVVIVSQYISTMQIGLRSLDEVHMDGPRCGDVANCTPQASLNEAFAVTSGSDISLECWYNVGLVGGGKWKGATDGASNTFAQSSYFTFTDNETWLVSSPLAYAPGMHLSLSSIRTVGTGDGLTVWVSTDLAEGDVAAATWTEVTGLALANGATAPNAWVESGSVDLAPFLPSGGTFVVGFKHVSTDPNDTRYGVDNIVVN